MKYYSTRLKQLFNTEDELVKAEKELDTKEAEKQKQKEAKAARLKEIEEAYKGVEEATKKYNDLVDKFAQDYGYYHSSVVRVNSPKSFYDFLLNYWPW